MLKKKCACGCGKTPAIAKNNHATRGHIKGQQFKFMPGHNNHGPKLATPTQRESWLKDMKAMGEITINTSKTEIWDMMLSARIVSQSTQFEDIGFSRLMRSLDAGAI